MTTKDLIKVLRASIDLIGTKLKTEGEKSAEYYLKRLRHQWRNERPMKLRTFN